MDHGKIPGGLKVGNPQSYLSNFGGERVCSDEVNPTSRAGARHRKLIYSYELQTTTTKSSAFEGSVKRGLEQTETSGF